MNVSQISTLASFEATIRLVNDISPTTAANNAIVAMPVFQGFQ
jgi:hypothetical protein